MKIKLPFFIFILACFVNVFSQGYWTQKANFPATARCSGLGLATSTNGYLIGGYRGGVDHFNDCWKYDPATNIWTQVANFPGAKRRWLMGFVLNEKLYVGLGAFMNGSSNYTYYSDFYEYNPATNVWTQKASFPGTSRVAAFSFSENNRGYVGGGQYASLPLNDLWLYNASTDTWTQRNNINCGARWAAVTFTVTDDKVAYIALGANSAGKLNDLWQYNYQTDTWIQKANFPGGARWYSSGFGIGHYGYVGVGNTGTSYFQNLWQYDPTSDSWSSIANLTGPGRCEAIGFSINNRGYIGVGLTSSTTYTIDFWEFTPSWMGVNDEYVSAFSWNIYPNPTNEILTITMANPMEEQINLTIYDLSGKIVLQKSIPAEQTQLEINLTNLNSGKYLIEINGYEFRNIKPFVKLN